MSNQDARLEQAEERIVKALDNGVPPEELDPPDVELVGDAAIAPQPPEEAHEPEPDHGDPEQDVHRELLWGSLGTSRLDKELDDSSPPRPPV